MTRGVIRVALAVSMLVLCLLVATVAAERLTGTAQTHNIGPLFTRRILESNSTAPGPTSSQSARLTGALALYSLFGLFVLSSVVTCVIGIIATLQWPNPRICCYRTPYSDIPSSESCGCCALHRLNIGFAVTWVALLVLLVLALIVFLIAAAAVLAMVHAGIAYRLHRQLKAVPDGAGSSQQMQMAVAVDGGGRPPGLVTGVPVDQPLPGVPVPGIPVISVPMSVAIVEAQLQTHIGYAAGNCNRASSNKGSSNRGSSNSSRFRNGDGGASSSRRRSSGGSSSSDSSGVGGRGGNAWRLAAAAAGAGGDGQAGEESAGAAVGSWRRGDQAADARSGAVAPDGSGADLRVPSGADGRPATSAPFSWPGGSGSSQGVSRGGSVVVQEQVQQQQQSQQFASPPSRGGWLLAEGEAGRVVAGGSGSLRGGPASPSGGVVHAAVPPHAVISPRGGQSSQQCVI